MPTHIADLPQCMGMRSPNFHYSADPHDISAQIDLIGMPWLMIREDLSAAPIGGDARQPEVLVRTRNVTDPCTVGAGCYGRRRCLRWRAQVRASIRTRLSEASTAIVTSTAGTRRT